MWWTSARSVSARARAIVVFPVPGGPIKLHADWYGLAANLASIRFGLSKPTKSAITRGRYFSASGIGNRRFALIGSGFLLLEPSQVCNRLLSVPETRQR